MSGIANFETSQAVALSLSKAWQFLSGETGEFDVLIDWTSNPTNPTFAEFSVFMPLTVDAESRTAGVGVLIQREDATIVASHMFGLTKDEVNEDDLRDACAEVCNVISGCITPQVSASNDIKIGLPSLVCASEFEQISQGSVLILTYMSGLRIKRLFVLIYGVFLSPSMA